MCAFIFTQNYGQSISRNVMYFLGTHSLFLRILLFIFVLISKSHFKNKFSSSKLTCIEFSLWIVSVNVVVTYRE